MLGRFPLPVWILLVALVLHVVRRKHVGSDPRLLTQSATIVVLAGNDSSLVFDRANDFLNTAEYADGVFISMVIASDEEFDVPLLLRARSNIVRVKSSERNLISMWNLALDDLLLSAGTVVVFTAGVEPLLGWDVACRAACDTDDMVCMTAASSRGEAVFPCIDTSDDRLSVRSRTFVDGDGESWPVVTMLYTFWCLSYGLAERVRDHGICAGQLEQSAFVRSIGGKIVGSSERITRRAKQRLGVDVNEGNALRPHDLKRLGTNIDLGIVNDRDERELIAKYGSVDRFRAIL